MFDFGNDDKEKLKENMEEIKEIVNKGGSIDPEQVPEAAQPEEQGFEEEPDTGFDQDTTDNSGFEPVEDESSPEEDPSGQTTQSFDGAASPEQEPQQPEEQQLEEELESFEEKFGAETEQEPEQQGFEDETEPNTPPANQQRSKTTKSGATDSRDLNDLSQEVPSPPETREIDVPEIDRGPLFLRQQKFRRAKQLIDEMRYLSQEIENTVNSLEAGIQEDQATERNVREMLKDLEAGRSDVEDIISPREE